MSLTIQPSAMVMPPNATISRGPFLGPIWSTIQPSIGVSQVSSATNRLKATWMSAAAQPCALPSGWTNNVQPYCSLAIMTIATMPMISCSQRVVGAGSAPIPSANGEEATRIFFLPRHDP
jgi:hypothetical protein